MTEQTKTVTFEGKQYDVPVWVNWVARDKNGDVYGYEYPPTVAYYDGSIFSKYHGMVKFLGNSANKIKWWDTVTRI